MDRQIPKEEQRKVLIKRLLKWGVNKLKKFREMETLECVFQYPFGVLREKGFPLRGRWHDRASPTVYSPFPQPSSSTIGPSLRK